MNISTHDNMLSVAVNEPCDCNTPLRQQFAQKMMRTLEAVAKEHGLEMHVADHNPFVIAMRGCLKQESTHEAIEVSVQMSGDLRRADLEAHVGIQPHQSPVAADQIFRSFDLSEIIQLETLTKASPEMTSPCDGPVIK